MNIVKVYHIEITDEDWKDLQDCGTLHFKIDEEYCMLTRAV